MKKLYDFILNKEHHQYRHSVDWDLGCEYSAKKLSPIERMADRFERLCDEEKAIILDGEQIVFFRTVSNLPAIFTNTEWKEINDKHYIHELGFMSNPTDDTNMQDDAYQLKMVKGIADGIDEYFGE